MPPRKPGQAIRRELYRAVREDEYTRTRAGREEVARVLSKSAEQFHAIGLDALAYDLLAVALRLEEEA